MRFTSLLLLTSFLVFLTLLPASTMAGSHSDWEPRLSSGDFLPRSLTAQITSLDPDYLVSARVVDLEWLPGSDALVLAQTLLRWLDPEGATIIEARGVLLLELSRHRRLLQDAYFGPEPAGRACGGGACRGLPHTLRSGGMVAEALDLEVGGEISLTLWKNETGAAGRKHRRLHLRRLTRNLQTLPQNRFRPVPTRLGLGAGNGSFPPNPQPTIPPNTLIGVEALDNTELRGTAAALEEADGQVMTMTQLQIEESFGIAATFVTFEDPSRFSITIQADCLAPEGNLLLSLLNQANEFEEVLPLRCADILVREKLIVPSPGEYIHFGSQVFLRVEVVYEDDRSPLLVKGGRDAVDLDELVIESEP